MMNDSSLVYGLARPPLSWEAVGRLTRTSPVLTIVAGFLLFMALLRYSSNVSSDVESFRNAKGQKVKEYPHDVRLMKFVKGPQLSEEGKALAGDEPYLVRNGPYRELVISTPADVQEFLRKDYKDHTKAVNLHMGDYAGRLYGHCLGEQNGQKWKMIRLHFDPDFSHQSATRMIPLFTEEVGRWLETLPTTVGRAQASGNSTFVDMVKASKLVSFRLISLTLYGEAFNEKMFSRLQELDKLHHNLIVIGLSQPRTASKWYNMLPTTAKHQMDSFLMQWKSFNLEVVHSARERKFFCPAERIYKGVDAHNAVSEIEFLHTLIEILFANVDITGLVLASMIDGLAKDDTLQHRLRDEVTAQKKEGAIDMAAYVSIQDSVLHHITLEAVRLVSHVHFAPPEFTGAPKVLSGYNIPARTPIVIDVHRLNTHSSVWGEDALLFRPDRFADMAPARWRYGLMRFGIASGRCLGKNMADAIMKVVATAIVEAFDISAAPDKGPTMANAPFTAEVAFHPRQ